MKLKYITLLYLIIVTFCYGNKNKTIKLPEIVFSNDSSIENIILNRRSIRTYSPKTVKIDDVSKLLWAGQGITSSDGLRAAPSAGALYPIELYLVSYNIEKLEKGVYKYIPQTHSLKLVKIENIKEPLSAAALSQECVKNSMGIIVITAVFERTTRKYGERGRNYVYFEAGCVAENIHLMAENLKIGTVVVGAFYEEKVKAIIGMEKDEIPIALLPFGYK